MSVSASKREDNQSPKNKSFHDKSPNEIQLKTNNLFES